MKTLLSLALGMIVLAATSAEAAGAKNPGGGSGGGSGGGGGGWNKGGNVHWNPGWYTPRNYNPGYVVGRPVLDNPLPDAAFAGGVPIKITNPPANRVTLTYTINGTVYRIQPGYSQELPSDRRWVIEFGRGGNFGSARYGLEPGLYTFAASNRGWELFHSPLQGTVVNGNPLPPRPDGGNPLPQPGGNPLPPRPGGTPPPTNTQPSEGEPETPDPDPGDVDPEPNP